MKMQVLTAAVLTALASPRTFAASEGGDSWSAVQPQAVALSPRPLTITTSTSLSSPEGIPVPASEGGDTWSGIASAPATESADLPIVATTGSLSALQRDRPSELPSVYGTPLNGPAVDRGVRVGPESDWINVGYGESVRFIIRDGDGSERSFAWRFDVSPEVSSVDLNRLAPADFPEHGVRVFVSPNPLYQGG